MTALSVSYNDALLYAEVNFGIDAHTISRRTSPAENVSPSAFFHTEIPPSVIVGLIAGIDIFERA
jgi:hypothetical protein